MIKGRTEIIIITINIMNMNIITIIMINIMDMITIMNSLEQLLSMLAWTILGRAVMKAV